MSTTKITPLLIAALAAIFMSASSADAASNPLRYPQAVQIARAAWPDSPCKGREVIVRGADERLAALDARDSGYIHTFGSLARAYQDGSCLVLMSSELERSSVAFCQVLTHEFGHLAGLDHSPDPHSVMYALGPLEWKPCERLERRIVLRGHRAHRHTSHRPDRFVSER